MLTSFTHETDGNVSTPGKEPVIDDLIFWLKAIALNVLSGAAFNIRIPWPTKSVVGFNVLHEPVESDSDSDSGFPAEPKTHLMSWQYCMNQIMDNFYLLIGFSPWLLEHSPWKFVRNLPSAYEEFMSYIQEMIDDVPRAEGTTPASDDDTSTLTTAKPFLRRNDLLSNILRANKNDLYGNNHPLLHYILNQRNC
jgi:hypothetical protein